MASDLRLHDSQSTRLGQVAYPRVYASASGPLHAQALSTLPTFVSLSRRRPRSRAGPDNVDPCVNRVCATSLTLAAMLCARAAWCCARRADAAASFASLPPELVRCIASECVLFTDVGASGYQSGMPDRPLANIHPLLSSSTGAERTRSGRRRSATPGSRPAHPPHGRSGRAAESALGRRIECSRSRGRRCDA